MFSGDHGSSGHHSPRGTREPDLLVGWLLVDDVGAVTSEPQVEDPHLCEPGQPSSHMHPHRPSRTEYSTSKSSASSPSYSCASSSSESVSASSVWSARWWYSSTESTLRWEQVRQTGKIANGAAHTHDCENLSVGLEKQRTSEGKLVRLARTVPVDGVEGRCAMCSEPAAARKRRLELPEARFRAAWLKQRPDMVIARVRRKKTQRPARPHARTKKRRARASVREERKRPDPPSLAILTHHPPPQHAMADKDKAGECVYRLVCGRR